MEQNVGDNDHKLYNEFLVNFKLYQLCTVMLTVSLSKNVLICDMSLVDKCLGNRRCSNTSPVNKVLRGQHYPDNQIRQRCHDKRIGHITDENGGKNPQQKYEQAEFNNTWKESYIIIKWNLFQGCNCGSTSANQSMLYTTLTKRGIKTTWLSQ